MWDGPLTHGDTHLLETAGEPFQGFTISACGDAAAFAGQERLKAVDEQRAVANYIAGGQFRVRPHADWLEFQRRDSERSGGKSADDKITESGHPAPVSENGGHHREASGHEDLLACRAARSGSQDAMLEASVRNVAREACALSAVCAV